MGCGYTFTCVTCLTNYQLGYGSSLTWLTIKAETLEQYDSLPEENKSLKKNQNYRACLSEHQGHRFLVWNEDWSFYRYPHIISDIGYGKIAIEVPFGATFKKVSLD